MFRGFKLSSLSNSAFSDYYIEGNSVHEKNKDVVQSTLESFLAEDGSLLASKISASWFPNIKCDVFISHSHKDSELAIGFAGWLKEKFGLIAFVDSCVWGYSEKLLKKIDEKYCKNNEGLYDYDKRNRTTSHVNILLSTALSKMIDGCECVVFLNTPSSISCKGYVTEEATHSPWVYSEIAITKIIEKRAARPTSIFAKSLAMDSINEDFKMAFDLELGHLKEIQHNDLILWERKNHKTGPESLDKLYEMMA